MPEQARMDAPPGELLRVDAFFDRISGDYDQSIARTVPPYREMFDTLISYSFLDGRTPLQILELGCGTGNLSLLLSHQFPQAHLTLVDLANDMLHQAERKLTEHAGGVALVNQGFLEADFEPDRFDLVVSSLALHHLRDVEKTTLYEKVFKWLKPGGRFRCADQVLSLPMDLGHALDWQRWAAWARQAGATDAEIQMWEAHGRQHDHYAPLYAHFCWLEEAGFKFIDCYWKKLWWSVFGAEKLDD